MGHRVMGSRRILSPHRTSRFPSKGSVLSEPQLVQVRIQDFTGVFSRMYFVLRAARGFKALAIEKLPSLRHARRWHVTQHQVPKRHLLTLSSRGSPSGCDDVQPMGRQCIIYGIHGKNGVLLGYWQGFIYLLHCRAEVALFITSPSLSAISPSDMQSASNTFHVWGDGWVHEGDQHRPPQRATCPDLERRAHAPHTGYDQDQALTLRGSSAQREPWVTPPPDHLSQSAVGYRPRCLYLPERYTPGSSPQVFNMTAETSHLGLTTFDDPGGLPANCRTWDPDAPRYPIAPTIQSRQGIAPSDPRSQDSMAVHNPYFAESQLVPSEDRSPPLTTHDASAPKGITPRLPCIFSDCKRSYQGVSGRNRHILDSHLPPSICCPVPGCKWTHAQARKGDFKAHKEKEHPGLDISSCCRYTPRSFVTRLLQATTEGARHSVLDDAESEVSAWERRRAQENKNGSFQALNNTLAGSAALLIVPQYDSPSPAGNGAPREAVPEVNVSLRPPRVAGPFQGRLERHAPLRGWQRRPNEPPEPPDRKTRRHSRYVAIVGSSGIMFQNSDLPSAEPTAPGHWGGSTASDSSTRTTRPTRLGGYVTSRHPTQNRRTSRPFPTQLPLDSGPVQERIHSAKL
ncbi:hypothetical protein BC834DRAFT_583218 [Gloeopeniophorella convolvens]|nr:hypothetical protein BC834DRAFT_583218 [Gloeopeniophorella convolvens]